jgi:hypothetical protein
MSLQIRNTGEKHCRISRVLIAGVAAKYCRLLGEHGVKAVLAPSSKKIPFINEGSTVQVRAFIHRMYERKN